MILRTQGSVARSTSFSDSQGPPVMIVENGPLEALLFDRNLIEQPFRELCLRASRLFIRHVIDELDASSSLGELVVLSKGPPVST